MTWLIAALLSFGLSGIAFKLKLLSSDGAIAAFLTGFFIFGFGEIAFSFSIIFFFLTANLFDKLKRQVLGISKKTEQRNAWQVLANGSVPLFFVCLWGILREPIYFSLYLTAICTATSDTWATELGALSKSQPCSILTFEKTAHGSSGGITIIGTLAACIGAISNCQFSAYIFSSQFNIQIPIQNILLISSAAIAGQFVDSLLGACCQVRYTCITCRKITEDKVHCGQRATIKSGIRWLTNDMVNFISIFAGIFIFWMCLNFMYL